MDKKKALLCGAMLASSGCEMRNLTDREEEQIRILAEEYEKKLPLMVDFFQAADGALVDVTWPREISREEIEEGLIGSSDLFWRFIEEDRVRVWESGTLPMEQKLKDESVFIDGMARGSKDTIETNDYLCFSTTEGKLFVDADTVLHELAHFFSRQSHHNEKTHYTEIKSNMMVLDQMRIALKYGDIAYGISGLEGIEFIVRTRAMRATETIMSTFVYSILRSTESDRDKLQLLSDLTTRDLVQENIEAIILETIKIISSNDGVAGSESSEPTFNGYIGLYGKYGLETSEVIDIIKTHLHNDWYMDLMRETAKEFIAKERELLVEQIRERRQELDPEEKKRSFR